MNQLLFPDFSNLLLFFIGYVSLSASFVQAALMYAALAACNNTWLKNHSAGPVESLWLKIIYGKLHIIRIWELPKQDFRITH